MSIVQQTVRILVFLLVLSRLGVSHMQVLAFPKFALKVVRPSTTLLSLFHWWIPIVRKLQSILKPQPILNLVHLFMPRSAQKFQARFAIAPLSQGPSPPTFKVV